MIVRLTILAIQLATFAGFAVLLAHEGQWRLAAAQALLVVQALVFA